MSRVLAPKGALYFESPSCATAVNASYFEGNQVPLDGGALKVQSAVRNVMPVVSNCAFVLNHAQRLGGAVDVASVTGHMLVQDSVLSQNTACSGGGAVAFTSTAGVTLSRCVLTHNSVVAQGCSTQSPGIWSMGRGGAVFHVRLLPGSKVRL